MKQLTIAEVADYLRRKDEALQADDLSGEFECFYSIVCDPDGLVAHSTGASYEAQFSYHAEYLEDLLSNLEDEYGDDSEAAWDAWCTRQADSQTLDNPDFRKAVQDLTDQANAWLAERIQTMSAYDYQELRDKAMETRNQKDIDALGEWLEVYGMDSWNGDVFDIDGGYSLRPILKPSSCDDSGEPIQWDAVGYDLV